MERITLDVLSEILLLLPFKHLLRCASVCRRWRALINGAAFLKRATSRYLTSRKDVPPMIRPANAPPSLAVLHRWLRGGLDEEVMNRYLTVVCNRLNHSGYFTRESVSSYLRSTADAITPEEYRDLFQPGRRRQGLRPVGIDLDPILKHFLAHGVNESVVNEITTKMRSTNTAFTQVFNGDSWYKDFKETLQQPGMWMCSYEYPRQRRVAWGVLRKLISLMKYTKRWTTRAIKSRMYGVYRRLFVGSWKIYILMNARFTVAILGRSC